MKIRSLKLKNHHFGEEWFNHVEDRWNYDHFIGDSHWKKDWISFDGVVYHPQTDRVYCGITSFDADIFKAYDRKADRFIDLDFATVANPYDAKFHRSMELTKDGSTLYMATALLHDVNRYWEAPGGGVFKHDIQKGKTKKLGIPVPHNYIQSIALDEKRGVIYSMHFTPEQLSLFDLNTGESKNLGPISSGMTMAQGENLVLDDQGCVWCGWNITRAWQSFTGNNVNRLCKYDPKKGKIIYFDEGLPLPNGSFGTAKLESLFNFGGDCLYASGASSASPSNTGGSLYRIDTKSGKAVYLGTPIKEHRSRLTSLVKHSNGYAYGVTGRDGKCRVIKFDPSSEKYELSEPIKDQDGDAMWQCHDITVAPDGTLYAAENDHPRRSSFLWEIKI